MIVYCINKWKEFEKLAVGSYTDHTLWHGRTSSTCSVYFLKTFDSVNETRLPTIHIDLLLLWLKHTEHFMSCHLTTDMGKSNILENLRTNQASHAIVCIKKWSLHYNNFTHDSTASSERSGKSETEPVSCKTQCIKMQILRVANIIKVVRTLSDKRIHTKFIRP